MFETNTIGNATGKHGFWGKQDELRYVVCKTINILKIVFSPEFVVVEILINDTSNSCYNNTTEIDHAIVFLCKIKEDNFLSPCFFWCNCNPSVHYHIKFGWILVFRGSCIISTLSWNVFKVTLESKPKQQIGHQIFVTRKKIQEDTLNIIWCTEPITAKCVFVAEFGFLGYQKR